MYESLSVTAAPVPNSPYSLWSVKQHCLNFTTGIISALRWAAMRASATFYSSRRIKSQGSVRCLDLFNVELSPESCWQGLRSRERRRVENQDNGGTDDRQANQINNLEAVAQRQHQINTAERQKCLPLLSYFARSLSCVCVFIFVCLFVCLCLCLSLHFSFNE